ncbi:hypothetical protein ColTof4_06351 [Colletotrichum tofieldiae]|uniref:Uncharacterized protein n=1 Tax=Colletotrichum tofieldiae TaxID=708197 RepID=A0A166TW21_9PEZI|nr:hypothetical protein CT0861_02644 [Colletotrichum tofieldiae]GKT54198.1 hypothetical protein ColTof3_01537 [Colletotrichum tofieldiae]GKT73928.1 hypothetical protein ColTof4_06351 [Colletotrichum tofieldiae]GKT95899.1 hypothetical protein Ct61P_13749 [Colletotrichum tofieldiae]
MEEQYNGDPTRDVEATTDPSSSTTLSSSELTLRFPRPQGNRQLASWISSSEPDMMNPTETPEDDSALGESTYELINTDDESQDGRVTEAESTSSFDYTRIDDVHSLAGTEHTGDMANQSDTDSDSEDEENAAEDRSRASSIQYAEQSLLNPSSRVATPPLGVERSMDTSNQPTPLVQSIEFDETQGPLQLKQVAVKHTIHSFTEEKSGSIAKALSFPDKSKRLIAAVRQTMASDFLATKEPLRIMYTGSHGAKHDIIYKISSAFTASASADECGITEDDGIYNVVPISSRGSAKVPEVELMKTSQYQIKVENCTAAREIVYQGERFPGETVYSITIDGDRTFQSAFAPSGSIIEPAWTLPHVAIFYVTENDDETAQKTRVAAWQFMQRHAVPCIFISNAETFHHPTANWNDMIDQHAIHLCVESSDRASPSVRLPIDLTTFLNIDARQMNRNLAYLTGLYDAAGESTRCSESDLYVQTMKMMRSARQRAVDATGDLDLWNIGQTLILSLGVIATALLCNYYMAGSTAPALSTVTSTTPSAQVASTTSASVSTSTITINLTSTTTIRVPQAKTSPSTTAVAPFAELADFLADKFPDSQKAYVCSAEKFGRNEILIKIPSGTKTSWLAKDSITIDVLKGERSVRTKFSSIDEGILIEIPKSEAYGVLTVAVNTTRKPKVNETFLIDFGKTSLERCLEYGKLVADHVIDVASSAARQAEEKAMGIASLKDSVMTDMRGMSARFTTEAAHTADVVKESYQNLQTLRKSRKLQDLKDQMDIFVTKAQISSRLLVLKVLQKTEEHGTYLDKAKKHMAKLRSQASEASKQRLDKERKELRARRKRERLEARCQTGTGFSRWTQQCKQQG